MSINRISITGLKVQGPNKIDARMNFFPGLNVIAGASDTGKTHIFSTIDYLFGAGNPPEHNLESKGYSQAYIGIKTIDGKETSIYRNLDDGDSLFLESNVALANYSSSGKSLSVKHNKKNTDSISSYLLSLIGLNGLILRKNQYGEKLSLTFRHLSHLTFIDELKIITRESPALSGVEVNVASDKSAFGYFITGRDESDIILIEKTKEKKKRLANEHQIIKDLMLEKQSYFEKLSFELKEKLKNANEGLDVSIFDISSRLSNLQNEIKQLEADKVTMREMIELNKTRCLYFSEQIKRLELLKQFYTNDQQRLEAVQEASEVFEELTGGHCAVCGSSPEERKHSITDISISQYKVSCFNELSKIKKLSTDVVAAINDLKRELHNCRIEINYKSKELNELEIKIQEILKPSFEKNNDEFNKLSELKSLSEIYKTVESDLNSLKLRLVNIEKESNAKGRKPKVIGKVDTASTTRYCEIVNELLINWKYPINGRVSFDDNKFDLVLGSQNRSSTGKGYRAITHAAFTIGLMYYCRNENIPHSGIVMLDTPLNPLKGRDEGTDGKINEDIKDAFYEYLAKDQSGDQFIIFENTEPPDSIKPQINYTHFTKNTEVGRYGFYPI